MNYIIALKNGRLQLVTDILDSLVAAPSTGVRAAGSLVIGTTALSGARGVLARIALPVPSFVISAGVATLQAVPIAALALLTGSAARAELRNAAGTVIVSGLTVGVAGANIIVSDTEFVAGAQLFVISGRIAHA